MRDACIRGSHHNEPGEARKGAAISYGGYVRMHALEPKAG